MNEDFATALARAGNRCQCTSPVCPHPVDAQADTNASPARCMIELEPDNPDEWRLRGDVVLCQPCYDRLSISETVYTGLN
ncbi:MAG: hypothetical protein GIW99_02495 [Candidatus Eremiobacteraeota bacterium]|nr:hypothetical protein [Candidatus Eremiobacteraeota bacterium]MBC5826544.1 hypothetical protein [Candidatus Eremiobacteraeota bacterium]